MGNYVEEVKVYMYNKTVAIQPPPKQSMFRIITTMLGITVYQNPEL